MRLRTSIAFLGIVVLCSSIAVAQKKSDDPVAKSRQALAGFDAIVNQALSDPMISERITPRDLVTHRSGLPRHDLLWYNNNEGTRAELVQRLAHLELSADLRERFQYNNLMYMTAGGTPERAEISQSTYGLGWFIDSYRGGGIDFRAAGSRHHLYQESRCPAV